MYEQHKKDREKLSDRASFHLIVDIRYETQVCRRRDECNLTLEIVSAMRKEKRRSSTIH